MPFTPRIIARVRGAGVASRYRSGAETTSGGASQGDDRGETTYHGQESEAITRYRDETAIVHSARRTWPERAPRTASRPALLSRPGPNVTCVAAALSRG